MSEGQLAVVITHVLRCVAAASTAKVGERGGCEAIEIKKDPWSDWTKGLNYALFCFVSVENEKRIFAEVMLLLNSWLVRLVLRTNLNLDIRQMSRLRLVKNKDRPECKHSPVFIFCRYPRRLAQSGWCYITLQFPSKFDFHFLSYFLSLRSEFI